MKTTKQLNFTRLEGINDVITTGSLTCRLVNIYRPLHRFTVAGFLQDLSDFLEDCVSYNGKLLILGDFNFHSDVLTDNDAERFLCLLNDAELHQHVICPTHVSSHTLVKSRLTDHLVLHTTTSILMTDHNWVHTV